MNYKFFHALEFAVNFASNMHLGDIFETLFSKARVTTTTGHAVRQIYILWKGNIRAEESAVILSTPRLSSYIELI